MIPNSFARTYLLLLSILATTGCIENPLAPPPKVEDVTNQADQERVRLSDDAIYDLAKSCVTIEAKNGDQIIWLSTAENQTGFVGEQQQATAFYMQPSDLGTYLLYDGGRNYIVATEDGFSVQQTLVSDIDLISDTFVSPAEWELEISETAGRFQFRHRSSQKFMGAKGLVDAVADGLAISIKPTTGCVEHPEMSIDAKGAVSKTTFDNGDLYGVVDSHSHILSNFGFGGGYFSRRPLSSVGC